MESTAWIRGSPMSMSISEPRVMERRFRVTFPWPSAFGAKAVSPDNDMMMMAADSDRCAVCMDDLLLGAVAKAKQLPCKHVFHEDCSLPWLHIRSSCPVCRHEIEVPTTDDPASPRVMERRFGVTLPWPFGFGANFGAQQAESNVDQDQDAAGSPSGDYNNDANANANAYDDDLD